MELKEMQIKEQIYNFAKEELEFYEVAKSMRNIPIEHLASGENINIKLSSDEEILSNNFRNNESNTMSSLKKPAKQGDQMQQYLENVKVYNKQKEKLEKLFKQKTNGMKYLDIEAYKKAKNNRVLFTFAVLIIFIFGVFSTYSYYKTPLKGTS